MQKEQMKKQRSVKSDRRGKKNITGGQLSWLFLEDCFSILQLGWREQGGSVWQLVEGEDTEGEKGREEKEGEVKECMVHLNLKTVQYTEYSRGLLSLKG